MKQNRISFLICISVIALFAGACKKSFFTDVNINPNVPGSVAPNLILPTAEAGLGYTQGGDISRYTSLITQQVFGANSQSQVYYSYGLNPGTFENVWADLYTSVIINIDTLKNEADEKGFNQYSGISRILMAYTLQVAVDLWGKIPYSDAVKGNASLHPSYDDDKALYDTIASLVNVGMSKLSDPKQGSLTPAVDDVIYNGDPVKWIKFGHAIKARLYIHQSKGDAAMAQKALDEVALSFTDNSQNAQYRFAVAETAANPWYQFIRDRPGDELFDNSTLIMRLEALNDPRRDIFIDQSGSLNTYYGSVNSPVEFITYDELLFIKAEATLRVSGDYAVAQGFYRMAIQENMKKLGVDAADIATYIAAQGTLPTSSIDNAIAQVANQEFIALYLNPEAWVVWRRTGSPSLSPTGPGEVPRRLLYPQTELSYNTANTPAATLYTPKIFWDK
ncbi:MAG TPA: SusD/RagB family nutrient-binding outer membrane lipoprotein [Chitinophagaceae bacterium]|nr:SusD/RagB family nutrient-binding outer membrane lipoprotein [Chitinophagaceae bacterium]